ncbi:hypothetical protein [Providencia sp. PROV202]|uniref:hypothetical protein n=1 Tax=Providencia sp. PROV202 TaxID=2949902 RepID=UPI00234AF1B2|nr:hypothetical protein [Providencia sp. PROV202]
MTLTMKKGVAKAILALCLLKTSLGVANTLDVTIPPDTEVAYVSTNSSINLVGPLKATQNWPSFGLISVSSDGAYCISVDALYEEDNQYYFQLMNENHDHVGYFSLSYFATANWVEADGSEMEGSVRVINGEVVQIDNLEAIGGNPYCLNPPGSSDDFFDPTEDREVNITLTGGEVKFLSADYADPGEYTIALENGTDVETLYGASLSRQAPGDLSEVLINTININVLDACTIDVNGNTSPTFHLASDEDIGLVDKEHVTVEIDCDSNIGNTVLGSVRLQTGLIKDEPNKFYLINEDYEDNGLYIEGIINQNGSDCDDEGEVLFNGEIFDIDLDSKYGDYSGEFTIDWNLCKDEHYIEPGIYHGALDLSVFVK